MIYINYKLIFEICQVKYCMDKLKMTLALVTDKSG